MKDAGHNHDSANSRLLRLEEIEDVQLRWIIFSMFRAQLFESGRIDEIDINKKIHEEHRGSTWRKRSSELVNYVMTKRSLPAMVDRIFRW